MLAILARLDKIFIKIYFFFRQVGLYVRHAEQSLGFVTQFLLYKLNPFIGITECAVRYLKKFGTSNSALVSVIVRVRELLYKSKEYFLL